MSSGETPVRLPDSSHLPLKHSVLDPVADPSVVAEQLAPPPVQNPF